jgi:hypothetical protein
VYDELEQTVMHKNSTYKGYIAYYVTIIPGNAKRFDKLFTPSNNETETKKAENKLIREIDGYSFYALVTGHEHALFELYNAIPNVIETLVATSEFSRLKNLKPNNFFQEENFKAFFVDAFGKNL